MHTVMKLCRLVVSVWEVRHGSIMALREILTYQGPSAGILIPEVSSRSLSVSDLKVEDDDTTIKREREIDLNLQVPLDESEPILKRPKIEDAAFQISESSNAEICMKVDEEGLTLKTGANGEVDINSVKVESQSGIESACHSINDATEVNECSERNESLEKMNILESLPQNSELMNFVKDARNSWLRNCEFLQDCAIRFLCVLSLDRYDLFYKLLITIEYAF